MSFSPVQGIYHHFERSNSGPKLFPLPKQLLTPTHLTEQPQHFPPCSANTPASPKPPTSGTPALQTPPQHIARASYQRSLQYFTQGYASPCMDKSLDPGNTISEWEGRGTPAVISAMTALLCPCTKVEVLRINGNMSPPAGFCFGIPQTWKTCSMGVLTQFLLLPIPS